MITIISGLPGAGKTLFALRYVQREFRDREIYFHRIPGLELPWINLDERFPGEEAPGRRWTELPTGAVIVLDEAQRTFRPRGTGAAVPEWVSALEEHRHHGIDLVLITQDPKLIDTNVRRLCGRHFHVVRKFGTHAAVVHEWAECHERVSGGDRSGSIRHDFPYPTDLFKAYKSAELHTHKRRIPLRVWIFAVVPVVLFGSGYLIYDWITGMASKHAPQVAAPVSPAPSASTSSTTPTGLPGRDARPQGRPRVTAQEYILDRHPRIAELPHTAPIYDGVTSPKQAPIPAACVSSNDRCVCYTQQATKMRVSNDLCRQIVAFGFFVDWQAERPPVQQRHDALALGDRPARISAEPAEPVNPPTPVEPVREPEQPRPRARPQQVQPRPAVTAQTPRDVSRSSPSPAMASRSVAR